MYTDKYYVDKTTATPADTLLAFGVVATVEMMIPDGAGDLDLRLEDNGDCYQISLAREIDEQWITKATFFSQIHPLDTATKKSGLPNSVNYVGHQTRNNAYFEARKKGLDTNTLAEQGLTPPHIDWPSWALINQMSATNGYNLLIANWHAHSAIFPKLLQLILAIFQQCPNDLDAGEEAWKALAKQHGLTIKAQAPQLQAVNPGMGKGGNKSKANGLGIGGLNGFWLIEYLKFVGLFHAAIPRVVSGSKDRKTYVLRPKSLNWRTHRRIFPDFQQGLYAQTAIKMDVLATLRYCKIFLEQWKAGQGQSMFQFIQGRPGDHVAAIEAIHYKHLGSAHATMNLSALILPQWLPCVETVDQANQFLELLAEHETIVRNLGRDKKSQQETGVEHELLRDYRNFLSGRDLRAFYQFTATYAGYVMSKLIAGGFPPRRFHISNLEVLIMNHNRNLSPILQSEGFRRIAEAIRNSTVDPQRQKSQGNAGPYEIRYGLGTDLLRNASYPEKFAQALGKFIYEYNQENARVVERFKNKPPYRRKMIRTGDLEEVLTLIDEYRDSETVANLLIAFGYASNPRNRADDVNDDPAETDAENVWDDSDGDFEEDADDIE